MAKEVYHASCKVWHRPGQCPARKPNPHDQRHLYASLQDGERWYAGRYDPGLGQTLENKNHRNELVARTDGRLEPLE